MKTEPRGFTLIELLTVIAIVGILVGIIIPVVGASRASARKTACLNNLRQIGAACQLYAGEHKGRFPYGYYVPAPGNSGQSNGTWDIQISPYLGRAITGSVTGDYPALLCPSDVTPATASGNARRSYSMIRGSDGFGVSSNAVPGASGPSPGIMQAAVAEFPRTLLIVERSQSVASGGSDNLVGSVACSVTDRPQDQINYGNGVNLHAGLFNYLFADGHVESLRPEATIGTGTMTSPKGMWTLTAGD